MYLILPSGRTGIPGPIELVAERIGDPFLGAIVSPEWELRGKLRHLDAVRREVSVESTKVPVATAALIRPSPATAQTALWNANFRTGNSST